MRLLYTNAMHKAEHPGMIALALEKKKTSKLTVDIMRLTERFKPPRVWFLAGSWLW